MRLQIVPVSLKEAMVYTGRHHRHLPAPIGGLFAVGVSDGDEIRGVCIVARPIARRQWDGWTVEVTRLTTDSSPNACSMLYGAAWRAARALGYRRLITYTMKTEPGTSLLAAGLKIVGETEAKSWNMPSRPRVDKNPLQERWRWEVTA